MFPFLMILVDIVGSFQLREKAMYQLFLINSSFMLNDISLVKSNMCNLIGVGNITYSKKKFQQHGITHRLSCPHTHQQNSAVERKHRHIVKTGLALLSHANVPRHFWDDAFVTSCYLIN
jgi:hypothetical protein